MTMDLYSQYIDWVANIDEPERDRFNDRLMQYYTAHYYFTDYHSGNSQIDYGSPAFDGMCIPKSLSYLTLVFYERLKEFSIEEILNKYIEINDLLLKECNSELNLIKIKVCENNLRNCEKQTAFSGEEYNPCEYCSSPAIYWVDNSREQIELLLGLIRRRTEVENHEGATSPKVIETELAKLLSLTRKQLHALQILDYCVPSYTNSSSGIFHDCGDMNPIFETEGWQHIEALINLSALEQGERVLEVQATRRKTSNYNRSTIKEENIKRATELALEKWKVRPNLTKSAIAKIIHRELGVSKKTVENYLTRVEKQENT